MPKRIQKENQDFINFITSVPAFFILSVLLAYALYKIKGGLPREIKLFDFILIILASFRMTRLFVYDKVMEFFRNLFARFVDIKVLEDDVRINTVNFPYGIRRTVRDLLYCPWCTNVWMSLILGFFYFLSPLSWFFIFIIAISGAGTFIQIITNKVEFSK